MKPIMTIFGPVATRSGYGDMARDFCRSVIDSDKYEVKIISAPWGECPMTALSPDRPEDKKILDCIFPVPLQVHRQPEVHVHIGIPSEIQPHAKFNILFTAGIETNAISKEWLDGCNRANVIFATSEHTRRVIADTQIDERDQAGNLVKQHRVTVPVEVLPNCVHTDIFRRINRESIPKTIMNELKNIPEKNAFLFVGHWLKGDVGEDRKNVGLLIKVFCETFKNVSNDNRPALILKTSGATFSRIDQAYIMSKITSVRNSVGSVTCPNVYLLHGELTEEEMNGLYNHPKVKAHVTFTKGEGFGRPLLEASMSGKPIIASGWSGHVDFLTPEESLLIGGTLTPVHESAVWDTVVIREAHWFSVDTTQASAALRYALAQGDRLEKAALTLAKKNREKFSYDAVSKQTMDLLQKYVPEMPQPMALKLPSLKKI